MKEPAPLIDKRFVFKQTEQHLFTDTGADKVEVINLDSDALTVQSPNGGLYIDCITAQALNRLEVESVTIST